MEIRVFKRGVGVGSVQQGGAMASKALLLAAVTGR